MSEQNGNPGMDGTFNIFGGGPLDLGSTPLPDPFAANDSVPLSSENVNQEAQPAAPVNPQPLFVNAAPQTPAAPIQQAVPIQQVAPVQQTTPVQQTPKDVAGNVNSSGEPENLLSAAVAQAEAKQVAITADALFSKAPVFEYAAATEDISDTSITFEQLRIEKSSDFPELDDSKRVSWTMEYCSIVKQVSTPAKTVIGTLKKEIENSKEFLEALKKAKDKNPVCKVKPKITAQSKGIAGYKGVFPTLEEADASDKHIRILPARDGHVYEIRCTEAGRFTARAANVRELSEINAGFMPAFPPVPYELFAQITAFFRHFMNKGQENEVMVYIYWDKLEQSYRIRVPMQRVGKAHISVVIPPDETIDMDRYVHVADIHSHNSMPAFFSLTDNRDELATRVYIVLGDLDKAEPQVCARISVGGRFVMIDARQVLDVTSIQPVREDYHSVFHIQRFEIPECREFPQEWISMAHVESNVFVPSIPTFEPWDYSEHKSNFLTKCLFKIRRHITGRRSSDYEI